MRRTLPAAAVLLLAAASAMADEYAVDTATGLFRPVPEPKTAANPNGSEVVLAKRRDGVTSAAQTLPFDFPFFGRTYDSLVVSEDGWLSFETVATVLAENPVLPSTQAPNAVIAPLWDGLRTTGHEVVKFTAGTAPDRAFVIAWRDVVPSGAKAGPGATFEVVLHETTGIIDIAYAAGGRWSGLTYTAGIENETGTRAFGAPNLTNFNSGRPDSDYRFTPRVTAITGTITRDRPVVTETGLSGTQETLPVAGADVEIVREDTGETIAVGRTAQDGTFRVEVLGLDAVPSLSVDLLARGAESRVVNSSGAEYRRRIATGLVPDGPRSAGSVRIDATVDDTNVDFRRALNIQQAAQAGYAFANAAIAAAPAAPQTFPQLRITWTRGLAATTGYTPVTTSAAAFASVSDADANPDPYDDFVILREYGQHVLNTIATPPGALVTHAWTPPGSPTAPVATTESAAFGDGFSFWFAAAVKGSAKFIDTKATGADVLDLELPSATRLLPNVAGAVAASLWDLCDAANEPHDEFDGSTSGTPNTAFAVLTTVDQKLGLDAIPTGSSAVTIGSFFAKWRAARTAAEAVASAAEFIHHGTLPDDAFEPNDVTGAEKALTAGTSRHTGLVLNASNEDRFSFAYDGSPVALSVSYPETTAIDLQLLDPATIVDGEPAVKASVSVTQSPAVILPPAGLAAGTYVVRVAWKSGATAHYTLAISVPPTLDGVLPGEWTVGVTFLRTLKVTGGVPPVKFGWTDDVPGLSLDPDTGRLAGTPTVAGDYVLHIVMTDSSGAGPLPAVDVPLKVNPPLVLPQFFGIPAGTLSGAFDVGHGGTSASWTLPAGGPAATPGFTLTAGPTLRLEGASADPASFQVKGSATDATGITLTSATSQVVVSGPLAGARGTLPGAAATFGYWFEAIEGSRATIEVGFSGKAAPEFRTLIDETGATIPVPGGALTIRGGATRLSGVALPRTSKYFIVFESPAGYAGRVSVARARVRPPTRFSRVVDIVDDTTRGELRFPAGAGSRVRVVVQSGAAAVTARPYDVTMKGPSGGVVNLPPGRTDRRGSRFTVSGIRLSSKGEYTVTVRGEPGTKGGPLVVTVFVAPDTNTAFPSGN